MTQPTKLSVLTWAIVASSIGCNSQSPPERSAEDLAQQPALSGQEQSQGSVEPTGRGINATVHFAYDNYKGPFTFVPEASEKVIALDVEYRGTQFDDGKLDMRDGTTGDKIGRNIGVAPISETGLLVMNLDEWERPGAWRLLLIGAVPKQTASVRLLYDGEVVTTHPISLPTGQGPLGKIIGK
jgi:hypothetical protein